MRLLNVLWGEVYEHTKTRQHKIGSNELMYVDIKLNGRTICAMVDMNATHSFIIDQEARRLGLNLEKIE